MTNFDTGAGGCFKHGPFAICGHTDASCPEKIKTQTELSATGEKAEVEKKQSQRVFENIYDQLKQPRSTVTSEKHVANFITELSDGAKRHVDEIEAKGTTNKQIFEEIWQKMSQYLADYAVRHKGNQGRIDKKQQEVTGIYQKLTTHVNRLVKEGSVDPLTAKVFLRSMPALKFIGDYNAVTHNNESISAETLRAKNTPYVEAVEGIWAEQPDDNKEEQAGGFYHFNSKVEGRVKNRIYVSASLSQSPEQVVKTWDEALKETGLRDKIYFKLPTGLMKRFETIIIYQTDKTSDDDIERVLSAFVAKVPDSLLNEKDMPTGVPLRRGISTAPEPNNINTLLQYVGSEDIISYNQLMASLSQLSFELAFKDSAKSGMANPTPKSLKAGAGKYFDQMIALAGINPDTMVPNAQGGKQPAWAERLSSLEHS